jgi:hypothetical protein
MKAPAPPIVNAADYIDALIMRLAKSAAQLRR